MFATPLTFHFHPQIAVKIQFRSNLADIHMGILMHYCT
jgi:hypothetical protein